MTTIEVFFATNRNLIDDNTQGSEHRFGIHPSAFRVGTAKAKISNEISRNMSAEKFNDINARLVCLNIDKEIYHDGEYIIKGSDKLFPKYMAALKTINNQQDEQCNSALVFIPGFAYDFHESIERAALLSHIYSTKKNRLVPFVFSWPSDGKLFFSYNNDLEDAKLSGCGQGISSFRRVLGEENEAMDEWEAVRDGIEPECVGDGLHCRVSDLVILI